MKRILKCFEQTTSNITSSCLCLEGYGVLFVEFRHQQGNMGQGQKLFQHCTIVLMFKGRLFTNVVVHCDLPVRGKASSHASCSILMMELFFLQFHN